MQDALAHLINQPEELTGLLVFVKREQIVVSQTLRCTRGRRRQESPPQSPVQCECRWGVFFLSGPPLILKYSPTQNLGTPSVGTQNGPLQLPPTYLGLDVPNV